MKEALYNICMIVFRITLPLFLLMGTVMVVGELLGIMIANPDMMVALDAIFGTRMIMVSSICAFSGFFMGYLRVKK